MALRAVFFGYILAFVARSSGFVAGALAVFVMPMMAMVAKMLATLAAIVALRALLTFGTGLAFEILLAIALAFGAAFAFEILLAIVLAFGTGFAFKILRAISLAFSLFAFALLALTLFAFSWAFSGVNLGNSGVRGNRSFLKIDLGTGRSFEGRLLGSLFSLKSGQLDLFVVG